MPAPPDDGTDISAMPAPPPASGPPPSFSPVAKALDTANHFMMGAVDAAGNLATGGIVAPIAGGLSYYGTLAATRDPDAARAVDDAVQDKTTWAPRSVYGKDLAEVPSKLIAKAYHAVNGPEALAKVNAWARSTFGDEYVSHVLRNMQYVTPWLGMTAAAAGGGEAAAKATVGGAAKAAEKLATPNAKAAATAAKVGETEAAAETAKPAAEPATAAAAPPAAPADTMPEDEPGPAPAAAAAPSGAQPGNAPEPATGSAKPATPAPAESSVPPGSAPAAEASPAGAGSPQDKFMAAYEAATQPHPTEPAQRRLGGLSVEAVKDPTDPATAHIQSFTADQPGQGQGGLAMQRLTALADANGTNLTLDAIPQRSASGTLIPQEKLDAFYKAHGFESEETSQGTAGAMRRPAMPAEVSAPPMDGLPQEVKVNGQPTKFGPSPAARTAAYNYVRSAGLPHDPPRVYEPITPSRGAMIADAYERMPHTPDDPATAAAYDALIRETNAQYKAIQNTGLKIEFIKPGQEDPYKGNPRLATLDVRNRNHLWVYPTDEGFGQGENNTDHPLMRPTNITVDGKKLLANDVFRIVHDYFGHVKEGNGFRADGEFNAYRIHKPMYSPLAQKALATETLGQNAWVNFGPNAEANRGASAAKTVYAQQKAGLLPDAVIKAADVPADKWVDKVAEKPLPPGAAPGAPGPVGAEPSAPVKSRFALPSSEGAASKGVGNDEFNANAEHLRRTLPALDEVRTSALARDHAESGNDFQTSKMKDKIGARAKEVIANEQAALRSAVTEMGSGADTSPTAENVRGGRLQAAIDATVGHFKRHDDAMYEAARNAARNFNPDMSPFKDFMTQGKGRFYGTTEGKQLYEGIMTRAEELGLVNDKGVFKPGSGEQLEQLRQFLRESYTPKTGKLIGMVRDTLDDSLAKSMGQDVFKASRLNRATRGRLFDNNDAVAKYLPPEDGVESNRAVQTEKVMPTLTGKGTSIKQFHDVFSSLRGARDYFHSIGDAKAFNDVDKMTRDAYDAMRDHFAAGALKAGQMEGGGWNQAKFAQYLQDNEGKMGAVFSPVQMKRWADVNHAGNILKMDRSYPGAHAQEVNASKLREGAGTLARGAADAVAAHVGGPLAVGAAEMAGVGEKLKKFVTGDAEENALKKYNAERVTNLHDFTPKPPEKPTPGGGPGGKQGGWIGARKQPAILNVGLNVGDKVGALKPSDVQAALKTRGANVLKGTVQQSKTEPTFVATIDNALSDKDAHGLAADLKQESIAQMSGGKGDLHGPGADQWRPFKPDEFLLHDGRTLADVHRSLPQTNTRPLSQYAKAASQRGAVGDLGGVKRDTERGNEYSANRSMATTPKKGNAGRDYFQQDKSTDTQPLGARLPGQRGAVGDLNSAGKVKQFLTDQENAQLRSDTAKRLIDTFNHLPPHEEYAAAALAGQAKKGWYKDSAQAITNVFGPDAPRFAGLLAAMSPQTSVQMNFHNALRTFINWDNAGRPTDATAISKLMEQSALKNPKATGNSNILHSWVANSVRALTDPDPEKMTLSGPKVHSFYQNLRDNVHEVTNDAHMATFANVLPTKMAGTLNNSGPGKSPTYLAMSARVRQAAQMLSKKTGETWTPREVQETVWSWAKTAMEHANEQGKGMGALGPTIPELVKNGEITDDLIRSTPDFHNLFGAPEHAGFLAGSRYAEAAKSVAGKAGAGAGAAAPSEKAAAAARTLRPHLERAAKRLEGVRQERAASRFTTQDEE